MIKSLIAFIIVIWALGIFHEKPAEVNMSKLLVGEPVIMTELINGNPLPYVLRREIITAHKPAANE